MPKLVLLSTPAQKQFEWLEAAPRSRIRKALERLASGGRLDIRRLKGVKGREDLLRLRVGDYRVIYRDDPDAIRVVQIIHRARGYDWL
ncbi:MAG TPA: type II toxin-antitoxin system RelE/ParE family toxin [Thermoplasmata archaeon]|nr:type II toxin-antitoxin system RelE/ParE family toxin [Thermoplasmata archaeon]